MGLLKIQGAIRLEQFWPRGKSESDASKIKITVADDAFEYKADIKANFKKTYVFNNAYVPYQRKKQKIVKRGNQLVVRLQGVDAPELHYSLYGPTPQKHPTRRGNLNSFDYESLIQASNAIEYRQPMAETAVYELLEFLNKGAKGGEIPCTFVCNANHPADVCDKYGRLVGSLYVVVNKKEVHINQWLLENSLAFTAFYSGMSVELIAQLADVAEKAAQKNTGIHKQYKTFVGIFDEHLRYRPQVSALKAKQLLADDKGHLIHPKIFRRWCVYNIYRQARIQIGTFNDFLKAVDDRVYNTHQYCVANGNTAIIPTVCLADLVEHNLFTTPPADIVFQKSPVSLKAENGDDITIW